MSIQYRKDIDGLRAIAVLGVILFHAGFKFISGGFLGVDIFFVISGFLITSILQKEIYSNSFSFTNFYERRVRRIFPALLAVLFITTILFSYFLNPIDLKNFYKSLLASNLFIPNILFWLESGYFDTASELKPLLHTWSLGVEEQFYLIFPILLVVISTINKKFVAPVFIFFISLSFVIAIIHQANDKNAVFFLPQYRAWQLLLGSLMATLVKSPLIIKADQNIKKILSIFGLLLILFSYLFVNENDSIGGVSSLYPTLGASLIILFAKENLVGKILSLRPLVFIGLISYSAYLLHQPIFVFIRYQNVEMGYDLFTLAIFALIFLLSFLIWTWVEKPFRNKERNLMSQRGIFILFFILTITTVVFSIIGIKKEGFASIKFNDHQKLLAKTAIGNPHRNECHTSGKNYLKPKDACSYGESDKKIAVFGDSHAVDLSYALGEIYPFQVKHLSFSGCPPMLNRKKIDNNKDCYNWTKEGLEFLKTDTETKIVVIAYRIHAALFGVDHLRPYPYLPDEISKEERSLRWQSLINILEFLHQNNKKIILILPPPELPYDINQIISSNQNEDRLVGVSRQWWDKRSSFVASRLNEIPEYVSVVNPLKDFCDEENCYAVKNKVALYWDDNHPSIEGANILAKKVNEIIFSTEN